ncbi:MAG: glycosyltransferase family 4 protein [Actinobacteria bacterium]|nr:glycosyltransferase family 4 protein [Actinomycetota bacterium]MBI3687865.1 glycosyltransferase family 4 protein [Actinomycetota bacterium]
MRPPRDAAEVAPDGQTPGAVTGLRVGIDATPLLGARTGVGKYVEHLTNALIGRPGLAELRATAFTWRGQHELRESVPAGASVAGRRAPARGLQEAWARQEFPPVELLTGDVDVFHGTNFVLPPLRRSAGVVTVHDLAYLRLPETVHAASLRYRELVPRSLRRATLVLTPTRAVGEEIIDAYHLGADRVVVTPLGVHQRWFAVSPPDPGWLDARGLPPQYLLAVGTLEPRKGLDVLITAYRRLLAEEPEVPPLVLVGGSGWGERPDVAAVPAGRVVLPGYLTDDDLTRVVAGARLLAFPSRYEGFGLPPLEAMAAGVPVVASDLPAVREATSGLVRLVPPNDPDALAAALATELHDMPDPGRTEAARAHAATQTWQRCAELTMQAYRTAARG